MKNDPITIFGEVLFDQFPDGANVLGGAPFNVAWHLQALGQNPQCISRVGTDPLGKQIIETLRGWGMGLDYVQQDAVYPTGLVQVALGQDEPAFSILPNQAYDYIEMQGLEPICRSGILYHGTLAARSATSKQTLTSIKKLHRGTIFVDVNLRQPWWTKAEVIDLIKAANWVKLNIHELRALQEDSIELKSSMENFLSRHKLDGLILTCGEQGALALTHTGEFISVKPTSSPMDVVDTIGAGDAFSAIFLLGLNLGWPLAETMDRAQLFATATTRQQGATVADMAFYRPFISSWGV